MKNKIFGGLLALLGFSACSPWGDKEEYEVIPAYGVPIETFVVKGVVTDTAEKPIEGIRIVLRPADEMMYRYFRNDTVYTSDNGDFVTAKRDIDFYSGFSVTAVDVDGTKNGSFKPDERTFSFRPESSDYNWKDGAYLKEVRFVLEEETPNDK